MSFGDARQVAGLLDAIPDSVVLVDPDGVILVANRATGDLLGLDPGALRGEPFTSLLGGESASWDGPLDVERTYRARGGDEVPVLLSAAEVRDASGALEGVVCVARDLRPQKAAEAEAARQQEHLIQADKLISLGILTSGIAHEINNPCALITLSAPLVQRAWGDAVPILDRFRDEQGEFVLAGLPYDEARLELPKLCMGIIDAARRIETIVGDLKDFARTSQPGSFALVDLGDVVEAALALVRPQVRRATERLELELVPGLLVLGNKQRLEQVVVNLVQNACQSLPSPERPVAIRTRREGDAVVVEVEDEGVGIAAADLKHICDPFFTTRREQGGTGLGLSVSAGIAEEHGGELRFESVLGRGTRARLVLPAAHRSLS